MKKKKRKSTALWLPRLKDAVRKREIWVRKVNQTHHHQEGVNHYEIAIGKDLFEIDNRYRVPQTVRDAWRISVTDTGKQLRYTFLNSEYKNANVRFTTDAEQWFQETIGQIIAMYRMGAYQSKGDNQEVSDWF